MLSKLLHIFIVLFIGFILACFFSVPVQKIQTFLLKRGSFLNSRKRIGQILSVLIWYFFFLFFLILIGLLLVQQLSQYFSNISVEEFTNRINDGFYRITGYFPFLKSIELDRYLMPVIDYMMKLPGILGNFVLSILISIYLLIDWDYYLSGFRKWKNQCLRPKTNQTITKIIKEAKDNLNGYVKGQALDSLIMGICITAGLWLLRVPLGIPIGILSGIGNLIPYAGPIIGFVFTILFCLIEGKIRTLIFALIYLVLIQQLDSYYIGPKLLGKQMQIRPLLVILSVLIGGTLFGPIGMIFAVPAAGLIKSLIFKSCK